MQDSRYPIGPFSYQPAATWDERRTRRLIWIDEIAAAPARLRASVAGLTSEQLDTPYRDGVWTVRQVVHHVPESHMNAYIRFKLALTEDRPAIKPYDEAAWAKLNHVPETPIETSLALLDSLHDRFVRVLRLMTEGDFGRAFVHPELGVVPLEKNLALYAWHGKHHVAHVTSLRERKGWNR